MELEGRIRAAEQRVFACYGLAAEESMTRSDPAIRRQALTEVWQTRRMTFGRIIIGRRVG